MVTNFWIITLADCPLFGHWLRARQVIEKDIGETMQIERILEGLRGEIHRLNDPDLPLEQIQRLHFFELGGFFHVEYYGGAREALDMFATGISNAAVAPAIASIRISGPDEGINGTRGWAVSLLAAVAVPFANLRYLHVQQMQPTDHNRTIIGTDYEECGVLAEIAAKAPMLTALTVPSAPSREFFGVGLPHLAYLNVDAGYDTQGFILNLSQSAGFPSLECLEWGEYCESYMDDWRDQCTPFDHYKSLFGSDAFRPVRRFVFRNPVCSDAEIAQLKAMRPDLQMRVVRSTGEYVR